MTAPPSIRAARAALLLLAGSAAASRFAGFAGDLGRPEVAELYAELMNDSTGLFPVEVVGDGHDNGWGLWFRSPSAEEIHRSAQPLDATGGAGFEDYRAVWPLPLRAGERTLAVAHARLNSDQPPGFPGPHPFLAELNGRTVAFAHNGTVLGAADGSAGIGRIAEEMRVFDRLPVFAALEHADWGASEYKVDSESYFGLVLRNLLIRETYWPTVTDGGRDLPWCVAAVAQGTLAGSALAYTSANGLLAVGDSLYAWRDVTDEGDDYHSVCASWPGAAAARFVTLRLDAGHGLPAGFGHLLNRHVARAGLDGGRPALFSTRAVLPAVSPVETFLEIQAGGGADGSRRPAALAACPDGGFLAVWAEADAAGPRLLARRFDPLGLAHDLARPLAAGCGAEAVLEPQLAVPAGDPRAETFAGRLAWIERLPGGAWRIVTAALALDRAGGVPVPGAREEGEPLGETPSNLRLAALDEDTWLLGRVEGAETVLSFRDGETRWEQRIADRPRFDFAALEDGYALLAPGDGAVVVFSASQAGHRAACRLPSDARERLSASPAAPGGFLAAAYAPFEGRIRVQRFLRPAFVPPGEALDTTDADAVWWTPALTAPVAGQVRPRILGESGGAFHLVYTDGGDRLYQAYAAPGAGGPLQPARAGALNQREVRTDDDEVPLAALSETFVDGTVTASVPEAFRRRVFSLWPAGGAGEGELRARIVPWIAGEFGAPRPPDEPVHPPAWPACALRAAPNPFGGTTRLRLDLRAPGDGWLRVYDLQGRLAATVREGRFPAGGSDWVFDGGRLASGVYVAAARLDGGRQTACKLLRVE